jgi:predicted ATPase
VQIAILGPLEVRDGTGNPIEVTGARLRALLVRLALEPGRPVAAAALMGAVWGERLPVDGANALQTLVSRLRRALGDAALIGQSPAGYRLDVEPDDVDACRFERGADDGARALRAGDAQRALELLRPALVLWRGAALADGGEALQAAATRLESLRATALIDRVTAEAQAGDPAAVLGELEQLAAEHPLDERIAAALMSALAHAGRQADALHAFERLRTRLADELGVDPSADAQAVHLAVLRGELDTVAPDEPRTNLTAPLTSFVGRDTQIARVRDALAEHRLVTLVGPGGAGKTRLASEAGGRIAARDGVWLAELAPLTDGADLAQAVLGALGLREKHLLDRRLDRQSARPTDAETRLVAVLADRAPLLVLDNCEHLLDECAALAEGLLGRCPQLRVLATSREPLGIIGEVVLAVPPLDQPAVDSDAVTALGFPAVRLFADRAAAARPGFVVDDDTVATVVDIARRLDGLPLAIELAAARLRTLPLTDIATRLSDRFRLLTGGSRTALPRHRTLRAVVRWSWELLTATERETVERLAVFPSGIDVESATAVIADDSIAPVDVPDLLASLVEKSLLQRVGDSGRVRMLETIREYGAEQLAERGEFEQVRARHADFFGRLVDEAAPHLTTRDQLPWFDRIAEERENVLAALRFRCDVGDADGALAIAVGLAGFAMMLGDNLEIGGWVGEALAVPGSRNEELYWTACALRTVSVAGSDAVTRDVVGEMGAIARRLADLPTTRPIVGIIGPAIAHFGGEEELAADMIEKVLVSEDPWLRAGALMFRAAIAENNGDIDAMRGDIDCALARFRELGERWGLTNALGTRALVHTLDGELDLAEAAYTEALQTMRELKSREDEARLLVRLGDLAMRRGHTDRARALMLEASESAQRAGAGIETVWTMSMVAEIERQAGNDERARELHHSAVARMQALPPSHPAFGHSRAIVHMVSARFAFDDGDRVAAVARAGEAYDAALGTRDLPITAAVGVVIADLAARTGRPEAAARILGASARLRGADDFSSTDIAGQIGRLRDQLGPRFDALYGAAKDLDRDAALRQLDPAEVFTPE